jgi:cell division ATPase FtsA
MPPPQRLVDARRAGGRNRGEPAILWDVTPRLSVTSRSSLSFATRRVVIAEDVRTVLNRAVTRCGGRILRALHVQWMLDGEEIGDPVGAFGETLSADVELLIGR